jgi:hypothetical protein
LRRHYHVIIPVPKNPVISTTIDLSLKTPFKIIRAVCGPITVPQ